MVTPREIRAARALLGWTRQELADRAIVSLNTVIRMEQGATDPRTSTVLAVRDALEKVGVTFFSPLGQGEEGVKIKGQTPV
ncbi:helix-turn-helix domain-containing protein [Telmatospirillum sp.]|uniref:helix-turn-helix transcriptional regulator n=1 Tax=Telmatospirillum sp. TaxID=2079197 RepID=UPI00283EBDD5|nr:helix-turn-helix domain-containing protein [Telmatospirillum sp.]MDR3440583.1 helix-turn-helix domain-containing protein [Telmatospirillum sp.]